MPRLARLDQLRKAFRGALAPMLVIGLAGSTWGPDRSRGRPSERGLTPSGGEDSAAVVRVVERFHASLASGDTAGVLRLLAPDVLIFEGGDMETREEYRGHHLGADVEFLRAVKSTHSLRRVEARGDAAWVGSTSKARGTFRGRALELAAAELVVLRRSGGEWMIAAVHWSSRERAKR